MHFRIGMIALGILVFALPVHAQQRQWCPDGLFAYDPGHPMAAEQLLPIVRDPDASLAEQLEQDWRRANADLAAAFRQYLVLEGLDRDDPNLELFLVQVRKYLAYDEMRLQYMRARYNEFSRRLGWEFEADRETGDPVSLFLDCQRLPDDPEGQAIAYFSDTLFQYAREGFAPAVRIGGQLAGDIYSTHRNRLRNGLPMWPQETFINGLGIDFASEEPQLASRRQWVLLRPSIAPALRFDGADNSALDAALVVEAFGFINYRRGSEYREWRGASAVATVTENNGVGYGAIYRHNNWIMGAAYHDRTDDWLLYVSVDLYDLVVPESRRSGSANAFLSQLGQYLKEKTLGEAASDGNP